MISNLSCALLLPTPAPSSPCPVPPHGTAPWHPGAAVPPCAPPRNEGQALPHAAAPHGQPHGLQEPTQPSSVPHAWLQKAACAVHWGRLAKLQLLFFFWEDPGGLKPPRRCFCFIFAPKRLSPEGNGTCSWGRASFGSRSPSAAACPPGTFPLHKALWPGVLPCPPQPPPRTGTPRAAAAAGKSPWGWGCSAPSCCCTPRGSC